MDDNAHNNGLSPQGHEPVSGLPLDVAFLAASAPASAPAVNTSCSRILVPLDLDLDLDLHDHFVVALDVNATLVDADVNSRGIHLPETDLPTDILGEDLDLDLDLDIDIDARQIHHAATIAAAAAVAAQEVNQGDVQQAAAVAAAAAVVAQEVNQGDVQQAATIAAAAAIAAQQVTNQGDVQQAAAVVAAAAATSAIAMQDPSTPEYFNLLTAFLRRMNPGEFGGDVRKRNTAEQEAALLAAATALQAAAIATASHTVDGLLPAIDDVTLLAETDPHNVWALAARMRAKERVVNMPMIKLAFTVAQESDRMADAKYDSNFEEGGLVDGHATGLTTWDAGVVLADLLTHPPSVLCAQHPRLARSEQGRNWSWKGKKVVELGAGASAIPSCIAALLGASHVFATDGDGSVFPALRENIAKFHAANSLDSRVPPPTFAAKFLRWGENGEAEVVGDDGVADVVLAADVLYILENPGAWGKLLKTIEALSGPHTLNFLTYTDRGHHKLFTKYLDRIKRAFHVVEVAPHLLHPQYKTGCPGRLEHHVGDVRIFSLAKKL